MSNLEMLLEQYHNDVVRDMALNAGIDLKPGAGRKKDLILELARSIVKNVRSKTYLAGLSQAEHALLGILLRENRPYRTTELVLPMVLSGLVFIEGYAAAQRLPKLNEVIFSLLRKGLIINVSELVGGTTRRTFDNVALLTLAPEVRLALSGEAFPFPESRLDFLSDYEPPVVRAGDLEAMLRRLFFVWADVRKQPLTLLKSGEIGKRDLRRLASNLGLDDNDVTLSELSQVCDLLYDLKLLREDQNRLVATEGNAVTLFWNARTPTHLREILKAYVSLESALPVDLHKLPSTTYYSSFPLQPYSYMRSRVVETLTGITTAGWVPFAVIASIFDADVGGLIIDANTRAAINSELRWRGLQRTRDFEGSLVAAEREVIVAILEELRRYGILDLGYGDGRTDVPLALRFSPLAFAALEGRAQSMSSSEGQVIAQPDFQVLALGPVPLGVLVGLERIAKREKVAESVISYRLVREHIYLAFQQGESLRGITAFLEEITGQPLPQNVRRTLEEWQDQYERIVLHRAVTILQTDSAAMMTKLLEDPQIGKYLNQLDERTVWLRTQHLEHVERRLWELEQLPAYSRGPHSDLPGSVRWRDETLVAQQPLPSLFTLAAIRRVAAETEEGWRLTPGSVRTAISSGMAVTDIIALIEQLTGEKLTPAWRRRIKSWGKHFGDANLAHVVLLKFEDAATLAELRQEEPRLGRWLRPLTPADGIAVVEEKQMSEALRVLNELGISVTEAKWW